MYRLRICLENTSENLDEIVRINRDIESRFSCKRDVFECDICQTAYLFESLTHALALQQLLYEDYGHCINFTQIEAIPAHKSL